jgi:hypothetical protein
VVGPVCRRGVDWASYILRTVEGREALANTRGRRKESYMSPPPPMLGAPADVTLSK